MLSEYAKGVLKAHRIDEENVVDVSGDLLITFKDGTQRRICENWTRKPI